MKISTLLLAALLLIGCATASDAKGIVDFLPGHWTAVTEINGTRLESHSIYKNDGTVEQSIKITQGKDVTDVKITGTWTVQGDAIITTCTTSNAPEFVAVGDVSRDKVTFIDQSQLSYVDEEGTAATEHRVP